MLTLAELLRLRRDLRHTQTLSIYLAGDAGGLAEERMGPRTLAHALAQTRAALPQLSAGELAQFDQAAEHAEHWLAASASAAPWHGLLAFVTATGVRYGASVVLPGPTFVGWGTGISIAPGIPALHRFPPVAVAVVDAHTAHLFTRRNGELTDQEMLHVDAEWAPSSHMGSPPRQGFHPGTRGTTATDAAQHAKQVERGRLMREVAERLDALASPHGVILIGGIGAAANEALGLLSSAARERARLLPGLDVHAPRTMVAERVEAAVQDWRQLMDREEVAQLVDRYFAGGFASLGRLATLDALRCGAVARLYVSEGLMRRDLPTVELAAQLALDGDADLAYVQREAADHLEQVAGGLAARLRFALIRAAEHPTPPPT